VRAVMHAYFFMVSTTRPCLCVPAGRSAHTAPLSRLFAGIQTQRRDAHKLLAPVRAELQRWRPEDVADETPPAPKSPRDPHHEWTEIGDRKDADKVELERTRPGEAADRRRVCCPG
jgi:hypothetical protein